MVDFKRTKKTAVPTDEINSRWGKARKVEIRRVKLAKPGDTFTGIILGSKSVPFEDVREKADSDKRHKIMTVWQFTSEEDNVPCELAGDWSLNSLLSTIPRGHLVRIIRKEQLAGKGGQKINDYDIRSLSPEELEG